MSTHIPMTGMKHDAPDTNNQMLYHSVWTRRSGCSGYPTFPFEILVPYWAKNLLPHVTLAVGHGFEARSLGPMIRRASKLQWEPTQTPGITKATTENMWSVRHVVLPGLTGYSRTHIPDYTSRTEPLREIVREAGPRNLHSSLTWTPEASTAFALLKTDLS
ncbi:unnamed protein product, partial [Coregonus sp. 'balchen']